MVGIDDDAGGFFAEYFGLWGWVESCAEISAVMENQSLEECNLDSGLTYVSM